MGAIFFAHLFGKERSISTSSYLLFRFVAHLPTDFVRVPHDAFPDVAAQTVDFTLISKLTWAVAYDFAWLEVAVYEQVSSTLFLLAVQQALEDLPQLSLMIRVLNLEFRVIGLPIVGKWRQIRAREVTDSIHDCAGQAELQVTERARQRLELWLRLANRVPEPLERAVYIVLFIHVAERGILAGMTAKPETNVLVILHVQYLPSVLVILLNRASEDLQAVAVVAHVLVAKLGNLLRATSS